MPNSITYKEHANCGNYSWKEFEHTILLNESDDVEQKSVDLINFVQRMIGYDKAKEQLDILEARSERLESRIEELKNERSRLLDQIKDLKEKYESNCLTPDAFNTKTEASEPDPDDIPFDRSTSEGGDF